MPSLVAPSILALAAVAAGATAAAAQPAMPPVGTHLTVRAEGQVNRVPDVATISAGVVTQAQTADAAMAENARRMAAATAALRKAGLADRDIRTASISLQPQYRYANNQPPVLTGYQASNQLSVRFRDVTRAGAILDALVAQGINQINGPDFTVDQPETALDEARADAVRIARARAEVYARAAGLSVARIVAIDEGGDALPPVRPVMMMARAAAPQAADTAIEPGEQKLSVTVTVSFELK
ncbi:SIMPL domain-containing protein [Sphingomonas quercus]|uniref:SIMPL domain-containing protein n=1 Tax=Sphingomonas quercus TaxID=2842451 RepID=A0ABS6BK86_9SPHN|nr:SIMPL domain-containing protein [Sphingomonas quercus]MBU3078037.1 SIMPL domain-containing protein [Sphingomonas quercus]